jgi:hypothetical protein
VAPEEGGPVVRLWCYGVCDGGNTRQFCNSSRVFGSAEPDIGSMLGPMPWPASRRLCVSRVCRFARGWRLDQATLSISSRSSSSR